MTDEAADKRINQFNIQYSLLIYVYKTYAVIFDLQLKKLTHQYNCNYQKKEEENYNF